MPTTLLLLKLVTTPLLIAAVTLLARRWGPGMSGWFIGFPLVSAPISIILALQYGPVFAAQAAVGTLSGQASVCVYCLTYGMVARVAGWKASIGASLMAFFLVTFAWNAVGLGLLPTVAIDTLVVLVVLRLIPRQPVPAGVARAPTWDIPARMGVAAAFVLLLTTFANLLGPHLSGLVSPFPVFSTVMAPFTHRQQGPAAATQLLRGVVLGSFAFGSFYLVIALLLPSLPIGWAYLAATVVSISVNSIALRFVRPEPRGAGNSK